MSGDMLQVTLTVDETGEQFVLDATGHASVMALAVEHDVPNIEGECGGEMTCGTCHVHLESVPDGYVSQRSPEEIDMLEVVNDPTPASRLACQLQIDDAVHGLRLRVPAV